MVLFFGLVRWTSNVSPTRARIKGPGTFPLNVQKGYFVSFSSPAIRISCFSWVTRSTRTTAGVRRSMAGGTSGANFRTAVSNDSSHHPEETVVKTLRTSKAISGRLRVFIASILLFLFLCYREQHNVPD